MNQDKETARQILEKEFAEQRPGDNFMDALAQAFIGIFELSEDAEIDNVMIMTLDKPQNQAKINMFRSEMGLKLAAVEDNSLYVQPADLLRKYLGN